jgi:hypothetical protein
MLLSTKSSECNADPRSLSSAAQVSCSCRFTKETSWKRTWRQSSSMFLRDINSMQPSRLQGPEERTWAPEDEHQGGEITGVISRAELTLQLGLLSQLHRFNPSTKPLMVKARSEAMDTNITFERRCFFFLSMTTFTIRVLTLSGHSASLRRPKKTRLARHFADVNTTKPRTVNAIDHYQIYAHTVRLHGCGLD